MLLLYNKFSPVERGKMEAPIALAEVVSIAEAWVLGGTVVFILISAE
jgi:hypothetical protein